jgi:hypothetical protein
VTLNTAFCDVTFEQYPELAMPRLNLRATKGSSIDDAGMAEVLAFLDTVLARGEGFTILWDVRNAPVPSRKQINLALDWISINSELLDTRLQGIAVCLSSLVIRSVVQLVLSVCQPPQPNGVFSDEPQAFAFARDKCTELKQWVGRKKNKRRSHSLPQRESQRSSDNESERLAVDSERLAEARGSERHSAARGSGRHSSVGDATQRTSRAQPPASEPLL